MSRLVDILARSEVEAMIRDFADNHRYRSAEIQVYSPLHVEMAGAVGNAIGKAIGLERGSDRSFRTKSDPIRTAIAAVMAATCQRIEARGLEENGDGAITLIGHVPKNWAAYGGPFRAEITPTSEGSSIAAKIVFQGQAFAWGEGKRRLRRFGEDLGRAERLVQDLDL